MEHLTNGLMALEGYIIRYGSRSAPITLPNGRKVIETILPGAFAESVAAINRGEYAIAANVEHSKNNALTKLGETGNNITLEHRADGVFMRLNPLDDSLSTDISKRVEGGLIRGLSIEFSPMPGEEPAYSVINGGDYLRAWKRLRLKGFAIVDAPMYADAQVFARSTATASSETAIVAEQIQKFEAIAQRERREYEAWLLGVR